MDKQKQIEEMATILCEGCRKQPWTVTCMHDDCNVEKHIRKLVLAGYGNLKEFARFIKSKLFDLGNVVIEQDIADWLKEYLNG